MSKAPLVEYAPGRFARCGERLILDGESWTFVGHTWWFGGGRHRMPPRPAELTTRLVVDTGPERLGDRFAFRSVAR